MTARKYPEASAVTNPSIFKYRMCLECQFIRIRFWHKTKFFSVVTIVSKTREMSDNVGEDAEEQAKLLVEKAKRRKVLREYFQKQHTDPFRHASGEGGTVVSTNLASYSWLSATFHCKSKLDSVPNIFLFYIPTHMVKFCVEESNSNAKLCSTVLYVLNLFVYAFCCFLIVLLTLLLKRIPEK